MGRSRSTGRKPTYCCWCIDDSGVVAQHKRRATHACCYGKCKVLCVVLKFKSILQVKKLMNKSKHVPSYSLYHHICCKLNKTCFSYHFVSLPRQILVLILNYQTSNFEEYALQHIFINKLKYMHYKKESICYQRRLFELSI